MRLLRKFVIGLGLLLTDVVFLCCALYMTVIAEKMVAVSPDYILWFGLVLIGFLVDLVIIKKKKQIALLLTWNLIWMIATIVIVALTFQSEPASIPFKIFVCGVLVIIEGHGLSQSLLPQRAEVQITFLDILVVVFAFFLAGCHLKGLEDVIGLQILGFIAVGYTLAALIFLRTYEEQIHVVRGDSLSSRVKVFGLLGAIVAISVIACGALSIMAKNATTGLLELLLLMWAGIKKVLLDIGAMFLALFRKIPNNQSGQPIDLGTTSPGATAEESGAEAVLRLPEWIFPLIGILIAVVIILFVIRLIWRFRKEKLIQESLDFQKIEITTSHIKRKKASLWQRFMDKLHHRLTMYRGRKSTEGLAILLRKRGKSLGVEMQPEDSWHGYAKKLLPYGEESTLLALSQHFELYFYGGSTDTLSAQEYHKFAHCLRNLKKDCT